MIQGLTSAALKAAEKKFRKTSAVIVAAGCSQRMGGIDKLFAPLLNEPLLASTLQPFQESKFISEIILVLSEQNLEQGKKLCELHGFNKVKQYLAGGESRTESSAIGIRAVGKSADFIVIHDGDRPLVTEELIRSVVYAAEKWGAATAAIPVRCTVKQAERNVVLATVPRDNLYEIQTPQAFKSVLIKGAVKKSVTAGSEITDDCMLVEAMGVKPILVQGDRFNIKVTYPEDLAIAASLARLRRNG